MSTTLAKPAEMIDRKWYVIDAAGKPLGRVAAKAAVLLRGKNKVTFTRNVDCGDHVIILNCDQAVLTGKKMEQKFHRTHSRYIGGLKEIQYKTLMAENSDKAMTYAVKGMIPDNTLGAKALTRLHCCKAEEHNHAAQKPEAVEI
ncbi:MAG: 50S ribosomal protein L13 [Gemmiger sp.]|nr:50S ribosomal protein L13 [Gemmiger sp.]